ncbi:hypothetical protein M758_UG289200 [Ceratodon purpureus]|nr:hypothetical protein M758_UG289200 [Ceratodon purpureus]
MFVRFLLVVIICNSLNLITESYSTGRKRAEHPISTSRAFASNAQPPILLAMHTVQAKSHP